MSPGRSFGRDWKDAFSAAPPLTPSAEPIVARSLDQHLRQLRLWRRAGDRGGLRCRQPGGARQPGKSSQVKASSRARSLDRWNWPRMNPTASIFTPLYALAYFFDGTACRRSPPDLPGLRRRRLSWARSPARQLLDRVLQLSLSLPLAPAG